MDFVLLVEQVLEEKGPNLSVKRGEKLPVRLKKALKHLNVERGFVLEVKLGYLQVDALVKILEVVPLEEDGSAKISE
jgi:hypothetical protein